LEHWMTEIQTRVGTSSKRNKRDEGQSGVGRAQKFDRKKRFYKRSTNWSCTIDTRNQRVINMRQETMRSAERKKGPILGALRG